MKRWMIVIIIFSTILIANAQRPRKTPTKPAAEKAAPKNVVGRALTGRVIDESGRPVDDAMVLAAPAGVMSQQKRPVNAGMRTATTGEDGRFAFDELNTGSYALKVYAPGYVVAPGVTQENGKPKYFHIGDEATLRLIKGGVITGMVTTLYGEPLIGVQVRAMKIKEVDGRASRSAPVDEMTIGRSWKTDDRGVYRIYGLEPGIYVVAAGGKGVLSFSLGAYDADSPTYYPTGTRDTATPITLQSGQEIGGINIQYRDNRGHLVSGTLSGFDNQGVAFVTLTNAATGTIEAMSLGGAIFGIGDGEKPSFALGSVSDGDYYVSAMGGDERKLNLATDETLVAPPRKVTVRGADVTGVELTLMRLGSISGKFVLENLKSVDGKSICPAKRASSVEEVVLLSQLDVKGKDRPEPTMPIAALFAMFTTDGVPNEKGDFRLLIIDGGRYHLDIKLPTEDWFIRSITMPANSASRESKEPMAQPTSGGISTKEPTNAQAKQPSNNPSKESTGNQPKTELTQFKDAAREGMMMKLGERLEGVTITASEGAAGLKGRVTVAKEGEQLPNRLRVVLVPAEPESADDALRYYETEMQRDATFSLNNLAPGKYFVIAQAVSEEEMNDDTLRPLRWDAESRKTLRKVAEALNVTLDFQPCQRVGDYLLKAYQGRNSENKR
ncbi:MAG: carboxypeptidase regulatory-like domain-containing protein [Acidobacteriota bacterium]